MKKQLTFLKEIKEFGALLTNVKVESVSEESYCQRYLGHIVDHKQYYLTIYADILQKLIDSTDLELRNLKIIDVGSGNGLLGLFAKYCGCQKVYLNDIDSSFIKASQKLAHLLGMSVDGFITGELTDVQYFLQNQMPDAIIGSDVIEHIYDLNIFFNGISEMNPNIVSVFTTASNPANYFKVRKLQRLQIADEFKGGSPHDFLLFGSEPHIPFIEMRRQIILNEANSLSASAINKLAKVTRGMNTKDIVSTIQDFIIKGSLPDEPIHPTNTCNPITGSWTEHIVRLGEYEKLYSKNGFQLKFYCGFYDDYKKGLKKYSNALLNFGIRIFGISLAPYIVLVGKK